MDYRATKTIRIVREYKDCIDGEEAKKLLDLEIEDQEFSLLIACYFKANRPTIRRID